VRTFVLVFGREKSFTTSLRISEGNAGVVESPLAVEVHNASEFTWGLRFFSFFFCGGGSGGCFRKWRRF
jgi:hypothetical protein